MKYEASRLAKKIKSREIFAEREVEQIRKFDFDEEIPAGNRYAVRKRKDLTTSEIMEIVHKVYVKKQMQKDVAKEHRLKQIMVSRLVVKAKKNKKYL